MAELHLTAQILTLAAAALAVITALAATWFIAIAWAVTLAAAWATAIAWVAAWAIALVVTLATTLASPQSADLCFMPSTRARIIILVYIYI